MNIPWPDETIFEPYNIIEETFKTVSSHDIRTAILIPKDLKPGVHPIIYNIHGGFLVTAHGLFAAFFPRWMDSLAREHSAIIVSPDYRLLPSANGVPDTIEDVEDGWAWTKENLNSVLKEKAPGHSVDFNHTLLVGGSAGGYLSALLSFSHPDDFAAVNLSYPLLDLKDKLYVGGPRPGEPNVLRYPPEAIPSKEDTLAWIEEKRKAPTTKDGFDRTPFAVSAVHNGLFLTHIVDNKGLNKREFSPVELLEDGKRLPKKIWLLHGNNDSTVPIRGSYKFAALLHDAFPENVLRFDSVHGGDHGFDYDESSWASIRPGAIKFITEAWLGE